MNHSCTSFYFKLKNLLSEGRISIRGIRMELGCNGGLIMQANIMIIEKRYSVICI